jgi:hypothetical protein
MCAIFAVTLESRVAENEFVARLLNDLSDGCGAILVDAPTMALLME